MPRIAKKEDLLCFIYLALRDSIVTTEKQLIKTACQYGGSLHVTKEEVKEAINMRLIDFLKEGDNEDAPKKEASN